MSIRIKGNEIKSIEHPMSDALSKRECNGCEHLYYNIVIPHIPGETVTKAVYRKQNTVPILDNPHYYNVSIARFRIGTNQVPIFISTFAVPQSIVGETVYRVTLVNNGNIETVPIIASQTTIPGGLPSPFYYTYTRFLKEVNTAINTAFNNLSAGPGLPAGSLIPYITFDQSQNVFTIHAQTAFYDDDEPDINRIDIFFNNELLQLLFFGNQYYRNGFNGNTDLLARISFYNTFNNIDAGYYHNVQDYSILGIWNSFKSLQIVSNLPIQNEFTENNYERQSGITTSQNILKDFIVLYSGDEVARTTIDYTVSEYEYIDLKGVEPIRNIEISIFWVDTSGNQYPLVLGPGESVDIKLMFKKKDISY